MHMNNESLIKNAKEDAKELCLFQFLHLIKLGFIFNHCMAFKVEMKESKYNLKAYIEEDQEGVYELVIDEDSAPLFKKQTFNELYIISGVSIFEKCCKDWFKWGLKYNPKRIKFFNKKIEIREIIESNDPNEIFIKKITDNINFQNVQISSEYFKNVFGLNIFESREEKYSMQKYIDHRHIISHNCGFADFNYVKKTGITEEHIGNVMALTDKDLEEFNNLIYNFITKIILNFPPIIYDKI
ncbi:hypothetical protein A994_00845 [Methanobacterium formicicum DSM 3637]|uniref:RiboL-PSP-HEPN domain-containing protein n=2 Tax=Methanobacterium formicicum TaxID=2162 RepID=K2REJ0_METFP|nr:hypothetical protein A994_00845 [Methanobacterium formicicum DSM 3637]